MSEYLRYSVENMPEPDDSDWGSLRVIFNPEAKRPFYDCVKSLDSILAMANGVSEIDG